MLKQFRERISRLFRRRARSQENPRSIATQTALGILRERTATVSTVEPCSLADYRQAVAHLPRPSNDQIDNYVQFVSEAHSWYKHLPLLPPGATFQFFVDPFSGYDRVLQPGGGVIHEERTEDSERFHYTWMTTRDYRSRFGYLSYESGAGTQFFLHSAGTVREYADLPVFSTSNGPYRIPPELVRAGSIEITAVIHHLTARIWVWNKFLPRLMANEVDEASRKWPAETGGDETLRQIIDVCNRRTREELSDEIAPDLESLLLPERQRLQGNMKEAIHRMLDLVYERGHGGA